MVDVSKQAHTIPFKAEIGTYRSSSEASGMRMTTLFGQSANYENMPKFSLHETRVSSSTYKHCNVHCVRIRIATYSYTIKLENRRRI